MFKKWLAGILVTAMVLQPVRILAENLMIEEYVSDEANSEVVDTNTINFEGIMNPRIVPDETMDAGQSVTYDCIWFGEYPQAEVIPDKNKYKAIGVDFLGEEDVIEDASLYSQLKGASYNSDNETTINGTKYKRILMEDAAYNEMNDVDSWFAYYWSDSITYHYFKYEPIKWRVIEIDSDTAFLLADKGIDVQKYNETFTAVTWETCSLRNYLNTNFYSKAFNTTEKGLIKKSKVENADNLYSGNSGGNDTNDNVFLLSEKEVYKTLVQNDINDNLSFNDSSAIIHGFADSSRLDEARRTRGTTYTRAMGAMWHLHDLDYDNYKKNIEDVEYKGYGYWWLRSPGSDWQGYSAVSISALGCVDSLIDIDHVPVMVRPAIKIISSSITDVMYAGTICTDGIVNEIKKSENIVEIPTPTPTPTVAPTVTPTPVVTVTPTPTPVPTIVPEPSPTVTATPTVEATATPISEAAPIVITANESNNLIMDDGAKIEISSVDKSKLLVKGKSGTYDASTGTFKAIKKGTAKLYYLDGKKKVVVCTIKVEMPKLKASLKMKAGKTKKLKLTGTKRTDAVWTSSDESVASMSGGIVTAKKAGECDIIAKIGKHEWKCHVVVK